MEVTNSSLPSTSRQSIQERQAQKILRIIENPPEIPELPESVRQEITTKGAKLENKVYGMLERSNTVLDRIPDFFNSKECKILFSELDKMHSRGMWLIEHIDITKEMTSEQMDDFIKGKISKFSLKHKKVYEFISKILKYIHK